ncbi:MAG TPA: class I SAM-dependent methyltransferase [Acidimicrobiia bacterium]
MILKRLRRQPRVLPGASGVSPTLTRDETERLLLPTRRVARLNGTAGRDDLPAFVGVIDEPATEEVSSRGLPVMRVRGWVSSTRGRPITVTVRAGREAPITVACDEPRPDVVASLAGRFGDVSNTCGFRVDVPFPQRRARDGSLTLVLDVDDGEYRTTRKYRITDDGEPTPARADYKATWDAAAVDVDSAKLAVSGYTDEDEYARTAQQNVEILEETVGLRADDEILEIGCGVGRVGAALAPLCRRWVGADVSANMLRHARERLTGFDNVELVELSGWDLEPIPSSSLDVVYCMVVFMHLDEWERFAYVREAMRVLRPGGRLYVDNFNLRSDPGWAFFTEMGTSYHPLWRPPNISKSSTSDELRTYLERAGFIDIGIGEAPTSLFLWARGRKP